MCGFDHLRLGFTDWDREIVEAPQTLKKLLDFYMEKYSVIVERLTTLEGVEIYDEHQKKLYESL